MASGQTKTPNDVDNFYIYQIYGWSREERDRVFNKYAIDIHWHSTPYPQALAVLNQLYSQHQISIITARPVSCMEVTIKWLSRYNINYHNLSLTEDKLAKCEELHVDVLIDDAPHYAEQFILSNKLYILYDQPYNQHIDHEMVLRARNWNEVFKLIEKIEPSTPRR